MSDGALLSYSNAKFDALLHTLDDAVALLVRHRTCDLQVTGSSPGWIPLRSGLGQAAGTPNSIIWYRPMG